MILDTNFIIDLMENKPDAVAKIEQLHQHQLPIFIASPTIFELWTGVAYGNQPEREKQKIKLIIENQRILELTKASAEEAGIINGTLQKQGQIIDPEDCLIAGIALQHNEPLLTRNIKHFQRIKRLKIETY
jgi:predicted nucleic acid-binding protein